MNRFLHFLIPGVAILPQLQGADIGMNHYTQGNTKNTGGDKWSLLGFFLFLI